MFLTVLAYAIIVAAVVFAWCSMVLLVTGELTWESIVASLFALATIVVVLSALSWALNYVFPR